MAQIEIMSNGLKRKANGKRRKSNSLTRAKVSAFAKQNGLKLVSKTVNPKRRKRSRRRNGLTTVTRTKNGLLGNTKADAKKIGFLFAGMGVTGALGKVVKSFVSPYLSQVGVGQYADIICNGATALVAIPFLAKSVAGKEAADWSRLGGLSVVAINAMQLFFPDALSFLPLGSSNAPVVVTASGQAALPPSTVAALVQSTDASPSDKAKVTGLMAQLEGGVGFAGMPQTSGAALAEIY